jgi:DNA/RNA endonuclease YhcR with UshA esterase domain
VIQATVSILVIFGMAASISVPLAVAHHSAADMDLRNPIQIEGVVKIIQIVNPHTKWIVEVTDEKGTRDIEFEGHSRNNIYRGGYRDGMVKVGDRVTLSVGPMRDGSDGGYVLGFTTVDGREIGL